MGGLAIAAMIATSGAMAAPKKPLRKPPARAATVEISPISLTATGLIIPGTIGKGPRTLPFGTPRAKAIDMVGGELGPPIKTGVYPDCGQGHGIAYAKFRSGIELAFVSGKFVGWTLETGGDKRHLAVNGVGIGASVTTLKKMFPDVSIDPGSDGGLGPMFQSDKWPSGWLDGISPASRVTGMFAGETCIVS